MIDDDIFVDINLLHDPADQKTTVELVKLAVELGYDAVVINIDIGNIGAKFKDESNNASTSNVRGKKRKQQDKLKDIPSPFKVDSKNLDFTLRDAAGKRPFRQYSRLTLTLDDPDIVHHVLKHPSIQEYDLVSVYPKTEAIFTTIINKTEIDIISLDMNERSPWISKGRLVQMAIEKGIFFEFTYASALSDSSQRRDAFFNGRDLVRACGRKKHGLIFSSRAKRTIELRAPFDVANLAYLFGVEKADDGRRLIGKNAKQLLLRSETKKKTLKGVMAVEKVETVSNRGLLDKLSRIPEFRVEIETVPAEADEDGEGIKRKRTDD